MVKPNYRGLKLTDQVMKLLEWLLDFYIHGMVNIDEMQFSLCLVEVPLTQYSLFARCRRSTPQLRNHSLYFAFINLEKAFDRMPRKVLWWAFRSLGVEEWAVCVIKGMYFKAWGHVRVNGQYSEEFGVGIGVHQGSVLSPLLFILLLEALLREFRTDVPLDLLYADDLVLIANTQEECTFKLKVWQTGMESKGLCINMK